MKTAEATVGLVLQELSEIKWAWRLSELQQLSSSWGWLEEGRGPGRITYRWKGDLIVDVFVTSANVDLVEVTLDSSPVPSGDAYDDKIDEFYRKFEHLVGIATAILGPPIFRDGAAAEGFPEDQDAVWLALWLVESGRLMIQQKHEGPEIPIRICIVIAP